MIRCFFLLLIIGFAAFAISAQITAIADDDDIQNWNDVNLTIAVNKKLDLYFPFTLRFDKNISRVSQERVGAGIVFKPTKSIAVTPFYSYIRSRNSAGRFRIENRFHLRFVYRFPFKKFGLSHRSQYEYRYRPTGNLWRYRPSITLEKELPKDIASGLKVFVTEEPFYESASRRFSRNRLSFGINKTLTKKLSIDIYYLRQDDNFSHPGLVHVIGTAWKIKL